MLADRYCRLTVVTSPGSDGPTGRYGWRMETDRAQPISIEEVSPGGFAPEWSLLGVPMTQLRLAMVMQVEDWRMPPTQDVVVG